jgi:hypothetical protein
LNSGGQKVPEIVATPAGEEQPAIVDSGGKLSRFAWRRRKVSDIPGSAEEANLAPPSPKISSAQSVSHVTPKLSLPEH